jgi:hypothetical protein
VRVLVHVCVVIGVILVHKLSYSALAK